MEQEVPKKNAAPMVTERTLYSWVLERNLRWQVLLVLLVLVTVGARVVPLELQKRIINQAIGLGREDLLLLYCLLFIAAVLLASALKFAINILQATIGQETLKRMRSDLFAHILSLPLSFFRSIQPGQVVNALINELASISGFVGSAISVPLINLGTLIFMGGYLFYLNPLLAGLCFILYPVQIVIVPRLQQRMNEANRHRVKVSREISGNIGEVVSGIHEVHGHAAYGVENDKFASQAGSLLQANNRMNAYRYGIKLANNLFENLGPFILFIVGGTMTIRGYFDLGSLVAFLSAYTSLSEPWRELMDFYQLLEDSRVRYKTVMASFHRRPEHHLLPVDRAVYRLQGNIELQGAGYAAAGGSRLLDGISLGIRHGEMVALVGYSGSGKSTLVQVIAQLLSATDGAVRLDSHEVRELSKADMAANLGIVPQHPFIFSGTIRENLLYSSMAAARNGVAGAGLPDLDRIIEVVQQVGIFTDILRFGVQARVTAESHPQLVDRLLALRPIFRQRFGEEHADDIEFFDPVRYLEYGSIVQNIVYGDLPERRSLKRSHQNRHFLAFLKKTGLEEPLVSFGASVALAVVPILRYAEPTPDLQASSPIPFEEIDDYAAAVAEIAIDDREQLRPQFRDRLLKLALNYIPGRHTAVQMPPALKQRILEARQDFRRSIEAEGRILPQFYDPLQYIESRNIRENILFGQPKCPRGDVEHIDQHLVQLLIEEGLFEDILDCGLDFQVGSMGEHLSGGQRQKIALARVFLRQPATYVLDEATAALDNASQARVQNFLQSLRGRHTILAVVHRLDTIADYDRIIVMKAGKVVECGTYQELMASQGALYDLVGRT
jgi:ABC-type multidrug transport system fused ATPase/permease subunit